MAKFVCPQREISEVTGRIRFKLSGIDRSVVRCSQNENFFLPGVARLLKGEYFFSGSGKKASKVKVVRISELVTVMKLKFCTGLRNHAIIKKSLSVLKIFLFAAIMGPKTCFLVQKCRFRSLLKMPARLPSFDFQPQIWYVIPLVNYLKMTVTAFFSKNIFYNQPAADIRTSFEARK